MTTTLTPVRVAVAATMGPFEPTYAKLSTACLQHSTRMPELSRAGVDELLSSMHYLAARLEGLRSEFQSQSEARSRLRDCIRQIGRRLGKGGDCRGEERLRETLVARRRQLRLLEELQDIFDRGVAAFGHAIAAFGMPSPQFATFAAFNGECDDARIGVHAEIRRIDAALVTLNRDYAAREERLARFWDAPGASDEIQRSDERFTTA